MRCVNIGVRFLICACLVVAVSLMRISAQTPAVDDYQAPTVSNQGAGAADAVQTPTNGFGAEVVSDSQLRRGNPLEVVAAMRISPGDDFELSVFGLPELTQHARVSNSGEVSLPLIGKLHLAGLSSDEAQAVIERRLADGNFVNHPHVSVYVKEYTTEGTTLSGEVNKPGVYSALVGHRLLDLIQTAGGFTPRADKKVTISHRDDPEHPITISLSKDLDSGKNNMELVPGDTVVASKAGIVYVVGEVNRPGGFVMESNKVTVSQVLAWAGGPTHSAALNKAKMIRRNPAGLQDVPVPLKRILQAKAPDTQLQSEDIIWIPTGKTTTGMLSNGYVLSMLTYLLIYPF